MAIHYIYFHNRVDRTSMVNDIKIKKLVLVAFVLSFTISLSEILHYLDPSLTYFDTPRSTSLGLVIYRLTTFFSYCFLVLYINIFKKDIWLKNMNTKYLFLGSFAINAIIYVVTFFPGLYINDKFIYKLHETEAKGLAFIWLVYTVICVLFASVWKLGASLKEKLGRQQFVRYRKETQNFENDLAILEQSYLTSFLLPRKKFLEPVKAKDFAIFFIDDGLVKGKTFDSKTYFIDKNIQELENRLDPDIFFRTNRQYLINKNAVKHLEPDSFGKTGLALNVDHEDVVISKLKSKQFKEWLVGFSS